MVVHISLAWMHALSREVCGSTMTVPTAMLCAASSIHHSPLSQRLQAPGGAAAAAAAAAATTGDESGSAVPSSPGALELK